VAIDGEYDATAITLAARGGSIPLLAAPQGNEDARLASLGRLLSALNTHKLIFLGPLGGLRLHGQRVSVVNLAADYAALVANPEFDATQRRLLHASHRLMFELVSHPLLVAMTSPLNLLHELFTVKGAGTLLRRGAPITRHEGYAGVDLHRLTSLIEDSFGRPLNPDLFSRPLAHAYIEKDYRGAALVLRTPLGGYLSKFAVTREAQGEGVGQDLWSALVNDYPALVWRARSSNPIRVWYERQCHGRFETGAFIVYVRGLDPQQIPDAIAFALAQPADF
jgi:acetylglutamate kinase